MCKQRQEGITKDVPLVPVARGGQASTDTDTQQVPTALTAKDKVFLDVENDPVLKRGEEKWMLDLEMTLKHDQETGTRTDFFYSKSYAYAEKPLTMKQARKMSHIAYREGVFIVRVQLVFYPDAFNALSIPVDIAGVTKYTEGRLMIFDEHRTFMLGAVNARWPHDPGYRIYEFMKKQHNFSSSPFPPSVMCCMFACTERGGLQIFLDQLAPFQVW